MKNKDKRAVSPVVGVVLMLGLAVSLFAVASLTAFDITPTDTSKPEVKLSINPEQATAAVVDAGNVDKLALSGNSAENITDVAAGKALDLNNGNQNPNIVATVDGNEVLVEEVDKEDLPGTTLTVRYNPAIEGAVVEALDANGNTIETATTPSNGEVRLLSDAGNIDEVRVIADGATINQTPAFNGPEQLYAETTKDFGAVSSSGFNLKASSNPAVANINGVETAVIYETDSSGTRLVSNLAELQAMNGAPDKNYRLVSNIDASPTATWNSGSGFEPIGTGTTAFDGSFDGSGNQIRDLTIDRRNSDNVALFSEAKTTSKVENVNLNNVEVRGDNNVAAAVASGIPTTTNIRSSGLVNAAPDVESDITLSNGNTLVRNTQEFTVKASDVRDNTLTYKLDANNDGDFEDAVDKTVSETQNQQVTFQNPYDEQYLIDNGQTTTPNVTIVDEHGQQVTSQDTQQLTINTPPTIVSDLSFDDTTLVSNNQGFTVTAEDVDGDTLNYRLDVNDNGDFTDTVDKNETAPQNQPVTFSVDYTSNGKHNVTVQVEDPTGETDSNETTITLNTAPTIEQPLRLSNSNTLVADRQEFSVTADDADGDQLVYEFDTDGDGSPEAFDFNGDGTTETTSSELAPNTPVTIANPYSSGGQKTLEVTVTDTKTNITNSTTPTLDQNVIATGGTSVVSYTDSGTEYIIHAFENTSGGTFDVQSAPSDATVDVLVVGGGGGGGGESSGSDSAGGGGGGGINFQEGIEVSEQSSLTVDVGDGGVGGNSGGGNERPKEDGKLGSKSFFAKGDNIEVQGFGGGPGSLGHGTRDALSPTPRGGGGGSASRASNAILSTAQGNEGGLAGGNGGSDGVLAGGGGAGARTAPNGGDGGDGGDYSSAFGTTFGESGVFSGGGGGSETDGNVGVGGNGGGGDGKEDTPGIDGDDGTGGGGGAGDEADGGDGGSGVVLVRYEGRAQDVSIDEPPTVDPISRSGGNLISDTQSFSVSASDPEGDSLSYEWDMGDGTTKTVSSPSHSYSSGGTFEVTVEVTDSDGGRTFTSTDVDINEPPQIDSGIVASRTSLVADSQSFSVSASDPDGDDSNLQYDWDFDNGNTATDSGSPVSHSYSSTGTYTVVVTVTDNDGVSTTKSKQVTIDTLDWDRENGNDDAATFEQKMNRQFNELAEFENNGDKLRHSSGVWNDAGDDTADRCQGDKYAGNNRQGSPSDGRYGTPEGLDDSRESYDDQCDQLKYTYDLPPGTTSLSLDIKHRVDSYESSGFTYYAIDENGNTHTLVCEPDSHVKDDGASCGSSDVGGDKMYEGEYQVSSSANLETFVYAYHAADCCFDGGDSTDLYHFRLS